jgi:hypothetical protein
MKRVLAVSVVLLSCHVNGLRGSGRHVEQAREVTAFKRIEVRGSTDVEVTAGQALKVVVSGDDNIVPHIRTRVDGDTLVIDMEPGNYFKSNDLVTISTPALEAVTITGSGDVDAHHISADRFAVQITGSGDFKAEGKAAELQASVTGSGDMSLYGLATRRAEVSVRGSGDVQVNSAESLKASVSGSGDVRYRGSPRDKNIDVRGSGSVEPG